MISHLSYSSITTYLTCGRAWYFQYIRRVRTPPNAALVFGKAFHDLIEDYITLIQGWERENPTSNWIKMWSKKVAQEIKIDWGNDSESDLLETGKRMLETADVIDTLSSIRPRIEGVQAVIEKRVQLTVPGVPIPVIGYIDLIAQDGVPCDLKTSAHAWPEDKAALETQPLFYLAALNQEGYKDNPEQLFRHYVFTKETPTVQIFETKHTVGEMLWLFAQITETWRAIQSEIYPPNVTSWKCSPKYCQFWSVCRGK